MNVLELIPPLIPTTVLPTIVIEMAVLLLMRERGRAVLLGSVLINTATNLTLNILVAVLEADLAGILFGEVMVVLVEALCYYLIMRRARRAFVCSLVCNATSFLAGIVLYEFII